MKTQKSMIDAGTIIGGLVLSDEYVPYNTLDYTQSNTYTTTHISECISRTNTNRWCLRVDWCGSEPTDLQQHLFGPFRERIGCREQRNRLCEQFVPARLKHTYKSGLNDHFGQTDCGGLDDTGSPISSSNTSLNHISQYVY